MAVRLGAHADRITALRALATVRGRRAQERFAFEGPTLLDEARRSGVPIAELYVTEAALAATPLARELAAAGTPLFIVDERVAARLSELETPTGLMAVAAIRRRPVDALLSLGGLLLLLADLGDPGNAGTLLRSAEAFGAAGVAFGRLGVDPYHPKVVRGAMGAIFRLPVGVADPDELGLAAAARNIPIVGLAGGGEPLRPGAVPANAVLLVGHERHGLGRWDALCSRRLAIPMPGQAESLNAAVAGSIALYERSISVCQESPPGRKSQDYRR